MESFALDWPAIRPYLDGTKSELFFVYRDEGSRYNILSETWGGLSLSAIVPKSDPPNDDQQDFEQHFKPKTFPKLSRRALNGLPRVVVEKGDLRSATQITHDWAKPQTWYQQSVFEPRHEAVQQADPTLFLVGSSGGVPHIPIDAVHGLIYQEDSLADEQGRPYRISAWLNGAPIVEKDPDTGEGDFSVDYRAGLVEVTAAVPGDLLEVEYHRSTSSLMRIRPPAGMDMLVSKVEISFARDILLTTTAIFQVVGWAAVFNPAAVQAGTKQTTDLVPVDKPILYKTIRDFLADSNGSFPVIPALSSSTWRGMSGESVVLQWDYTFGTRLLSAYGMEVHVSLQGDKPYGGDMALVTLYGGSEPS